MIWYEVCALMIGLVLVFMVLGFHVAFAFLAADIIGVWIFMGGWVGVYQLVANGATAVYSFLLVAIPLFIVMGELFFRSGLSKRAFDALDKLLGNVPARLSYITVAGGTICAAMSGSSLANTAMLGSVMLPEGTRRGYEKRFIIGPLLGSGGLAILIPPSILMVLLGSIGRIDVGSLLLAGAVPGIVLAVLYAVTIFAMAKLDPTAVPTYAVERVGFTEKMRIAVTDLAPLFLVIFAVVGTIIMGIATPSESAAFGVLAVLILMPFYRCFSWSAIAKALEAGLRTSVMIFIIIVGSATFSQILAYSGAVSGLVKWATSFDFSVYVMLTVIFMVLLICGLFLDAISTMLLTVPIFLPIVQHMDFNVVLFGVIMIISLEIGSITPPFGLALFIMHGVAGGRVTLMEICLASLPFLGCSLLLVILIVLFPDIALYLPRLAE